MKIFILLLCLASAAYSQEQLQTIEVTHEGTSDTLVNFVPSATVLKQNELKKRRENSLGDTLKNESGVRSTSFGPNAGRPIIRGLEGDRIKVLQNGLGVLDASSQSVDHAVPVDTMVVDSIEVVRGPMSLLYGSSAVGGVVNVNTNRIHKTFEEGSVSEVQLQGDSSQDALTTGAKIDYGVKKWMLHFDGGYRNANDLKIPGKARSKKVRQLNPVPASEEPDDELPNSSSVQKTAAVGASRIFDRGYAGLSYYFFDNFYGTVAEETVKIKMKQNRLEFHGEYKFEGPWLNAVRFKTAQSDYTHKEFEGSEVGTTFSNEGNESRLELLTTLGELKGISGIQTTIFNFKAVGEEAFLPTSRNKNVAIFTLQDLRAGKTIYTAGLRVEGTQSTDEEAKKEEHFTNYNGSLGARHEHNKSTFSSLNLSFTERSPNFQELFANGFHVATNVFEVGDEGLRKEQAYALDLGLRYHTEDFETGINLFTQQFNDYITFFQTDIDSEEAGVKESHYQQVDAYFYGFEVDAKKRLGKGPLHVLAKADLVRGKNKDDGKNLPRIAPPRITVGLEWIKDRWSYDLEAQYNFEQTKTAPGELRTDAYTLLNAGLIYDLIREGQKISFFGRLRNLLNQEARAHTSTLKDIAPMAGRNVVAGVQYLF